MILPKKAPKRYLKRPLYQSLFYYQEKDLNYNLGDLKAFLVPILKKFKQRNLTIK